MFRRLGPALVLLAVAVAACTGDDGGDEGADLGTTSSIAPPVAPSIPAASPAGTGVVAIGELTSSFEITECDLDTASGTTGQLLHLTGTGTRANGVPFTIDVTRSVSDEATQAFTDLITYTDTARILQVQRSESEGEVSDLREPGVRSTLLRVAPTGLSASGIAGPPGTKAPEGPGLIGLALVATCE